MVVSSCARRFRTDHWIQGPKALQGFERSSGKCAGIVPRADCAQQFKWYTESKLLSSWLSSIFTNLFICLPTIVHKPDWCWPAKSAETLGALARNSGRMPWPSVMDSISTIAFSTLSWVATMATFILDFSMQPSAARWIKNLYRSHLKPIWSP